MSVAVEQRRRLVTAIPGPRSLALQARKVATVAAGVGTGLPVYIERAAGGVLVEVDGNHLIDFAGPVFRPDRRWASSLLEPLPGTVIQALVGRTTTLPARVPSPARV